MKVAACLIVRDEARDLLSWFAHHAAIGVHQFLVFNHNSKDNTAEVLAQAARIYDVRVLAAPDSQNPQIAAYNEALSLTNADWCAFIDADEYLMCVTGDTLGPWLASMGPFVGGVLLNWAVFGSSGHVQPPADLVPRAYTWRAPLGDDVNRFFKSIVRVRYAVSCLNPHLFSVFGHLVDANGQQVSIDKETCQSTGDIPITPWRVNHYAVRSQQDFAQRLARGRPSGGSYPTNRWQLWDRNDEQDLSANHFYGARWQHELARRERTVAHRMRELAGGLT